MKQKDVQVLIIVTLLNVVNFDTLLYGTPKTKSLTVKAPKNLTESGESLSAFCIL